MYRTVQTTEEETGLYYYVDCPECRKDLSHMTREENLGNVMTCIYCSAELKLNYMESFDEELGFLCGYYYFTKV